MQTPRNYTREYLLITTYIMTTLIATRNERIRLSTQPQDVKKGEKVSVGEWQVAYMLRSWFIIQWDEKKEDEIQTTDQAQKTVKRSKKK